MLDSQFLIIMVNCKQSHNK